MYKLRDLDKLNAQIKASSKLQEVAQNLYGIELFAVGTDDYKALCPFHDEKTPSFGIRGSKQLYHCFGCKEGGDVISFVQKMDNIEYIDALVKLAEHERIDITAFKGELTAEEKKNLVFYKENEEVAVECVNEMDSPQAKAWLKHRRFDPNVLKGFKIGYSHKAPRDDETLELNWQTKWSNVITVPLMDAYGRITGFRNRLLDPEAQVKVIGPKKENPLPQPLFYGLYQARKYIRSAGYLILVEGEADVWQMACHGYRNVAATMGTKLNADMMAALESLSINQVILLADNDKAGRAFSTSVAYGHIGSKVQVKIAQLQGEGKDPDEILLASGPDAIGVAIATAKHAFEYVVSDKSMNYDLTSVTQKLDFISDVKKDIENASPLVRELATRMVADLTNSSYDVILDFIRESDSGATVDLHNILAERIVLKKMLDSEEFIGEAVMQIRPDDFYLRKHKTVFEIVTELYRKQKDVNSDVVRTVLENKGVEGATSIIRSIISQEIDTDSVYFMLDDLKDKSVRRHVQVKARDAANRLNNTKADANDIVRNLSADIASAIVGPSSKLVTASDAVNDRMTLILDRVRDRNPIIGLDLGDAHYTVNQSLHGLQEKRYVVLAAPSGAGKTAFACNLAKRVAVDLKVPTLFFTFETGVETLTDRIISNISGIPSDQFLTGFVRPADIERIQDAAAQLAASPLVITERGMVFEEFAAIVRHDVIKRGTKVVIVDYLQLMEMADARGISRHLEVGKISRGCLELTKELNITLIAVVQQNRESAKGNTTTKEGVGDSYKISQDCDVYIVFREKTKEELQADGAEKGNRVLVIDKNRHGKSNIIMNYSFDEMAMRFAEIRATSVRH